MILESVAKNYIDGNYSFPDDGLKKSLKNDPKFFLALAQAMMNQYVTNQCCIPYQFTKSRSISELRSFAKGEQDVNQYKPLLCQSMKQSGGKAYMNISWSPAGIIPKFRDVIKGIAIKTSFDISVDALDPSSIAEKKAEEAYWRLQTDPEWIAFSKEMAKLGARTQKPQFESEQQIDVWMKSGGLKLGVEIALQTALMATLYLSRFEDSVKVQLIDDLIDIGICGTRDYVENGTRYVKARYTDPEFYVGRFSQFLDNNNSDYGGELRFMTISELKKESDLKEAQLFKIAQLYQVNFGNPNARFADYGFFNTTFASRYKDVYGNSPIDDFKVPVLDAVYISADTSTYSKATREGSGNLIYNQVPDNYVLTEKEKKKGRTVEQKRNEVIYKFKHIVGTEFVFSYGLDEDIAHDGIDGYKTAVNPYHIYKLGTSSIVNRMVAYENDASLSLYKWRNAKARMIPPPGIVVEKGVLENITLGGVKVTPKQAISMGVETGYLVIQSLTDHGRTSLGANSSPISPMPNTAIDHFNIFLADMNYNMAQIKELTGINDLTAGGTPPERLGLGVAKQAIASSNNTLYPLFKGYEVVFEQTMVSCAKRWQNVLRNGDSKGFYKAIGQTNLQVFELSKDISLIEFGLKIEALPSEQEIEMLLSELIQLKQTNAIAPEVFVLVYRTIKSGNFDLAHLQMSWAVKEQQKVMQAMKDRDIQMNGKIQQESLQANSLATQAQLEQGWMYKKEELLLQAQIAEKADARKHQYTLAEIQAKGDEAMQQKLVGAQTELTRELIKPKKEPAKKNG